MEVIVQNDDKKVAHLTALVMADSLRENPDLVLGLATGRTMESVYAELVRMHKESDLDFSKCITFNLDEYVGLVESDPNSYRSYMNRHLFDHINIDIANTHLPDGMAEDYKTEAQNYEDLISEAGGIDLQMLGIGRSGHIGFNEPLSALFSRTREKALTRTTIEQNAPLFDTPNQMPTHAFTMGIGTILDARRIMLIATGHEKARIIAKAVEGPVTAMISATALQLHPATTVILDEAAASGLEGIEYYRWFFKKEPEWQKYRREVK